MSHSAMPDASSAPAAAQAAVLPTLFGEGYGLYSTKPATFVFSFAAHTLCVLALIWSGAFVVKHRDEIKQHVVSVVSDLTPYVLPPSTKEAGGGGGGGDRDKLQASHGSLPKESMEQITPPAVVVRNENPKLTADPSVIVPPDIKLPTGPQLGDPLSAMLTPPSNGTGSGGGIGNGRGTGVGSGTGAGFGPGEGGGFGNDIFRVGGGVTAPREIYAPDPEYSEQARKAKYQGTVLLWVVIGADGRIHDVHVQRSVGMGLDEKAVDAVRNWRFEPARKDGRAVAVQINIEVNFRLY